VSSDAHRPGSWA